MQIRVIMLEPNRRAKIAMIDSSLKAMQAVVGGRIEVVHPFQDAVGIVCNESGKLDRLPLNRGLRTEDGEMYDILAGTAFLVSLEGEGFSSLTDAQVRKYYNMFKYPEFFVRHGPKIIGFYTDEPT